ncbi:MAG: excinuclease ABC subunit UvrA [Prevotella sp.]|nr:excinuclease ABC subunit UvrA [Candidatus Equicola faecalis]
MDIEIKGARVNNLKNISLNVPQGKFTVITGVSGSGKSSLAFDTLYAEGQRRYIESLSAYARQFMGKMQKPECDYIHGLPPAIAIEQHTTSRNPRSTVGTSTEIYEYLRLLFARIGRTFSPISGKEVKKHTVDDVITYVQTLPVGTRFYVEAPIHLQQGRTLQKQIEALTLQGYSHFDGEFVIIDRTTVKTGSEQWLSRLAEACETAFYEGEGEMRIKTTEGEVQCFSTRFTEDGMTFDEPSDNMFSFNSPLGACPQCEGYGKIIGIDHHLVIPDPTRSIYEDAVMCWRGEKMGEWKDEFIRCAADYDFPIFEPYFKLSEAERSLLWHGPEGTSPQAEYGLPQWFPSIDRFFEFVKQQQYKIQYRVMLARYRGRETCPMCHGSRLKKEVDYVKVGGRSITELVQMPVSALKQWFDALTLTPTEENISKRLLTEIRSRLKYIIDVGLGYLTLNRPSNTLSGGESQRINLTTSIGSSLVGSLYILDEPTVGLHQRDTGRLLDVIRQLRDVGNTVVVVEHDEEVMRAADHLIDIGPSAGVYGGEVVFEGKIPPISSQGGEETKSYTLSYLDGTLHIDVPLSRRPWNRWIELKGANCNNLQNLDIRFPLNVMTVVTGVSGSGKSSLVSGTLYPALQRHLDEPADVPGEYSALCGDLDAIVQVEYINQSPIGKSSRSNPATYVKAFDAVRDVFAEQQLAKQMGFRAQHFSFNTEGGRCEECKGAGVISVEMQFMADIELECEMCHGKRYKSEVLDVCYKGKNISDVLDMSIDEALEFFSDRPQIMRRLQPLHDVGLGYIKMGQSSSTLSGGENQRVKLAYFIGMDRGESMPTLFIFDEPTTGLHFHDIQKLLDAFEALISKGHTVLIIEHNLEVIKCADHIIDLGPEGGDGGGRLVVCGTPEEVAQCESSITGRFLKEKLFTKN